MNWNAKLDSKISTFNTTNNMQTTLEMKYNINPDEIIMEEDRET